VEGVVRRVYQTQTECPKGKAKYLIKIRVPLKMPLFIRIRSLYKVQDIASLVFGGI